MSYQGKFGSAITQQQIESFSNTVKTQKVL